MRKGPGMNWTGNVYCAILDGAIGGYIIQELVFRTDQFFIKKIPKPRSSTSEVSIGDRKLLREVKKKSRACALRYRGT
jgi:hypothetical protein